MLNESEVTEYVECNQCYNGWTYTYKGDVIKVKSKIIEEQKMSFLKSR